MKTAIFLRKNVSFGAKFTRFEWCNSIYFKLSSWLLSPTVVYLVKVSSNSVTRYKSPMTDTSVISNTPIPTVEKKTRWTCVSIEYQLYRT